MVCATIFYPGRTLEDLFFNINFMDCSCIVSPLHDRDKLPSGEDEEPHYHVLVIFDDSVIWDQAVKEIRRIGGCGCEVVESLRSYARYLCHLDNPEKFHYPVDKVQCFGSDGLSYDNFL